ncbi:hypothetical protein RCL1_000335 [Eukaryota sp. TZLM3-RCL]
MRVIYKIIDSINKLNLIAPLTPSEVAQVIKKRPRGKAAGLSGLSIDHVKAAIIALDDCLELLTLFFNKTLTGQLKYHEELKRSRLTALVKNAKMDVPPIAVSECLHVILSACCLSRFNNRCKSSLFPLSSYSVNSSQISKFSDMCIRGLRSKRLKRK